MYCEALPCTVGILSWINLVPGPEKDRECGLGTRLDQYVMLTKTKKN